MIREASQNLIRSLFKPQPPKKTYSLPWIIWVEQPTSKTLHLVVLRPRGRHLTRLWDKQRVAHIEFEMGPILFDSPEQRLTVTEDLIDAGKEHIPPNIRFLVTLSLDETQDVIRTSWR